MKPLKSSKAPVGKKPAKRVEPATPAGRASFLAGVEPGMEKLPNHIGLEGQCYAELLGVELKEARDGSRIVVAELRVVQATEGFRIREDQRFVLLFTSKSNPDMFNREVVSMTQGFNEATEEEMEADPDGVFVQKFEELLEGASNGKVFDITFTLRQYVSKKTGKPGEATNILYGGEVDMEAVTAE